MLAAVKALGARGGARGACLGRARAVAPLPVRGHLGAVRGYFDPIPEGSSGAAPEGTAPTPTPPRRRGRRRGPCA